MRLSAACAAALFVLCAAGAARAQEPPPRIGPFAVDLHATVPMFPSDNQQLALSRRMQVAELPGSGIGLQASAHLYLVKISVVTIGIGAEFAAGRASQDGAAAPAPTPANPNPQPVRAAEERFSTFAPQLSLNFGSGRGWSYLSGGIGISNWALVPQGSKTTAADTEALETINYGGGARWFAKPHLAFSFDVRLYAINPGSSIVADQPGSPRTTLLVVGAGISLK